MAYTPEHLKNIIYQHELWLEDDNVGSKAVFSMTDLRGANFENADLRHVIFSYCDLRSANFHGVDLRRADFTGSNIVGADFLGANIRGADFSGVNLHGVNFGNNKIVQIGPIGSRNAMLTVKRFSNGDIEAMTGCFRGTLDALSRAAETTHAHHPQYLQEYRAAIAYCTMVWGTFAKDITPTFF